jgi:hypothetical protein
MTSCEVRSSGNQTEIVRRAKYGDELQARTMPVELISFPLSTFYDLADGAGTRAGAKRVGTDKHADAGRLDRSCRRRRTLPTPVTSTEAVGTNKSADAGPY